MTRGKKKFLLVIGSLLLLLAVAIVAAPLWLPWALRPIANQLGAHYDDYERIGYDRFALQDLLYTNANVSLRAQRVEAPTPTDLLWNRVADGRGSVSVRDWTLEVAEKAPRATETAPATAPGTNTPAATLERIEQAFAKLDPWLGRAALTNGTIVLRNQKMAVPWMVWSDDVIRGRVIADVPQLGQVPLDVHADFSAQQAASARITVPTLDLASTVAVSRVNGALRVESESRWGTNHIQAAALFADGPVPEWARVSAQDLFVPATNLPARGYSVEIATLQGGWTNQQFNVALSFRGLPADTNLPPVKGQLLARGDTNTATIQELRLESPALTAELSNAVQFSYAGELLSGPARLSVTGDLAQLPVEDLAGTVRGTVLLRPGTNTFPEINLQLTLTHVSARGLELAKAELDGELRWPVLRMSELEATLESGAEIQASAVANLTNRFLSNATVRVSGPLPTNFVPAAVHYTNLTAVAELRGPLTNLVHEATVEIGRLKVNGLAPMQLRFRERGEQFEIAELHALALTKGAALELAGSGEWNITNTIATLQTLRYWQGLQTTNAEPLLTLAQPVDIQLSSATNEPPHVAMSPLLWRGADRQLAMEADLHWPAVGEARISARGLRTWNFTNWLEAPLPADALVRSLEATAQWSNGPVLAALSTSLWIDPTNTPPILLSVTATNTAEAVFVPQLRVALSEEAAAELISTVREEIVTRPTSDAPRTRVREAVESMPSALITGNALLPVTILATTNGFAMNVHSNAPLNIDLSTATNAAIEELLASFVDVEQPSLQLSLGGTLEKPRGMIDLAARSLEPITLTNRPLPEVKNVRAHIAFNLDEVVLRQLRATIQGQPMTASATVPIADGGSWRERLKIEEARGELNLPSADIAAFAPFATNFLAPRGTLDVNLSLQPGMQLSGQLSITNAATAPLPTIGAIHDIDAEIAFRDRTAVIESIEAYAGGAPVVVTGAVNFADWEFGETNRWPDVELRIRGTNVALVRQAEKIIRTDLNLRITNAATGLPPTIAGTVHLQNSLYLSDLGDLVPQGVTKPSQRPPYFNVENDLLDDWPLQVHVFGEDFLRIRTPFAYGEVSADLHVRGDLGEPLAVGEVRLNEVAITFPFTSLDVKQGTVLLTSENPYQPQLFLVAEGRAYGYDIHLEISGTAQQPILEFSSVPPLTSEQILMMVTTGQIPREDYRLSAGQRAQGIGLFLGKNVLSKLGFGGGERLSIRSGENISEAGKETYSVEYRLTDDVSLIGEYDRFDEYNAGVKWRVFSK